MTQREYVRDLAVMTLVTSLTVAATIWLGPFAGLAAFGACLIVGGIVGTLVALSRDITELDRRYSRIDEQLDQEAEARAALRTQRTVHAEPQAQVVDLFSGKPIA